MVIVQFRSEVRFVILRSCASPDLCPPYLLLCTRCRASHSLAPNVFGYLFESYRALVRYLKHRAVSLPSSLPSALPARRGLFYNGAHNRGATLERNLEQFLPIVHTLLKL
jgi:hypothetical protein